MRAAFFEAFRTIVVRAASVPTPAAGEVRLRIRDCGICGSDLSLFTSGALAGPDVILGHEISAVVDLDPGGRWEPGTRVVPFPARGCGECLWCREGQPRYCLNPPMAKGGGYAEFACYPATSLLPIPDGLDDRTAALTEPFGVALRAVELASPSLGDLAYVSGLGSIGLLTVCGLRAAGCRVVGADPREDRRALGHDLGCEEVFDPTQEDPFSKLIRHDPHGPRVAFECSGMPESLQQVIDACGPNGTVGILGIPMGMVNLLRMTVREQRAFSIAGPSVPSMRRAIGLLRDGSPASRLITGVVPLEETGPAMERLAGGAGGVKVLVEPGR